MTRAGRTPYPRGPGDWNWKARLWLALVVLLAAPALLSPLALFPLPHGFPLSLIGALSFFLKVCGYAIAWAALSTVAAAAATFKGRLEPRVLAVIWFVALFAAVVAFSTTGRLAAYQGL